jgi:site-specific recombinase XerD
MAKQPKRPEYKYVKVVKSTHPKAPWRVRFAVETEGGKSRRVFKSFATEEKARSFADEKEREISNHGIRYGDIPPEVRRAFDQYRDRAAELRADGAEVPAFEKLIADSLAAIRADIERTAEVAAAVVTIAEGVKEFLAYKKSRVGTRQWKNLRDHLKRFAADHGDRACQSFTAKELEKWLSGLRSRLHNNQSPDAPFLSPLSRNHYRGTLTTLFSYAAADEQAWCPRNPLASIDPEQVKTAEPLAYSPESAQKLMQAALDHKPALVPVLTLQFFAGLRTSEAVGFDLGRLDFAADEFKLADGKTGARSCPFLPACKAWLTVQPRRQGPAWITPSPTIRSKGKASPEYGLHAAMRELFELAGVVKITNGARHSFVSYRCAETRNEAKVADEAGNSAAMLKKHYRNITTAAAAKKYFAIRPAKSADNVISMTATANDAAPAKPQARRKAR